MSAHDLPDDWTAEQRALFDRMFRHMQENQHVFTHPKAPRVAAEHWHVTAWNAAWTAVLMRDDRPLLVHAAEDEDEVLAIETPPGPVQ